MSIRAPLTVYFSMITQTFNRWIYGLLFTLLACAGSAFGSDPFQVWIQSSLVAKSSENTRIKAALMFKLDEHGDYIYEDNDIGLVYTGLAHWLDVGLYYKTIFRNLEIPGEDEVWKHEHRPHFDATARFKLIGLSFSNRARLEYNSLEDLDDFSTFRNRISINPPYYLEPKREHLIIKDSRVRPFASYEIFVQSEGGISQHRFQGGLTFRLSERILTDFYYLRKENRNFDSYAALNVAGATLKLLF